MPLAFCLVDRHVLFGKLTKLGVGITFLDLLMDCYPGDCIRSKAGSTMMKVMVLNQGVKQGCSPLPV